MRVLEMHYTLDEVACLLRLHRKTVAQRAARGDYGRHVVNLGTDERPDYRIPASGVNEDLQRRRIFLETEPGVAARTAGELRRKQPRHRGRFFSG